MEGKYVAEIIYVPIIRYISQQDGSRSIATEEKLGITFPPQEIGGRDFAQRW